MYLSPNSPDRTRISLRLTNGREADDWDIRQDILLGATVITDIVKFKEDRRHQETKNDGD
jgi:hypothetical protein